jgi:nitrite reductase/ring-hydroxylating ferredoxin subunit
MRLSARVVMSAGLLGGYGFLAWIGARFMMPPHRARLRRLFVGGLPEFAVGATVVHALPDGRSVSITRHGNAGKQEDFVALSSTCPHLGCQVHWEGSNNRYFCPCHNGTFDASGKGTGGPPGDAGLSLPRYTLAVEKTLLFILVPDEALSLRQQTQLQSGSPIRETRPCRNSLSDTVDRTGQQG